jgi:cyclohexanecarboxyl-CoA dehydrogenase
MDATRMNNTDSDSSFELLESLQDAARRFAREQLLPKYLARDKEDRLDRALMRQMGELGLLGVDLPEAYGGLGLGTLASGMVGEALAYGDFNIGAYVCSTVSVLGRILVDSAAPELARDWLPRIVRGEAIVGLGLTEPSGGSDAASLRTRAVRHGDRYLISGEKTSISMADQADGFIVFARTGTQESRARGVTAFFVPADAKGLTRTRFDDVGSRVVGRGSLFFDEVEVPLAHRIGDEGAGFRQVMAGFDFNRAAIGLECCGAAQASLDETWAYVNNRESFGVKLAQHQGVSFPLADGEARIEAIRQLCYRTMRLRDTGRPHTKEAAMCKLLAPRTAYEVIRQCLLSHGHYGYSTDSPHQQRMRDVMGLEIGDGTAQIMMMVIAREKSRALG